MSTNYYIINKDLFMNEKYANMSLTSKIAYSVLYDLLDENKYNTNNELYVRNARKQLQYILNLSINTITKIVKELTIYSLIREDKSQFGMPNIVYLYDIETHNIITKDLYINNSYNQGSIRLIKEFTELDVKLALDECKDLNFYNAIHYSNFLFNEKIRLHDLPEKEKTMIICCLKLMGFTEKYAVEHIYLLNGDSVLKVIKNCKATLRTSKPVFEILIELFDDTIKNTEK